MNLRRTHHKKLGLHIVEVRDAAGEVVKSWACNAGDWDSFLRMQVAARNYVKGVLIS